MKLYLVIVLVQVLSVITAIVSFRLIEEQRIAGLFAGGTFLLVVIGVLLTLWKTGRGYKSPTFLLGVVNLFLIVFPMIITRLLHWDTAFEDIIYFGYFTGTEFHALSERLYGLWILVTLSEGLFVWRRRA